MDVDLIDKLAMPELNTSSNRFAAAPPDPGFLRTPALLKQMAWLSEHPEWDYVLMQPRPTGDLHLGVTLADRQSSWTFRGLITYAAVTCADPKAVGIML